MIELGESASFETVALLHLDAAYNLARWLMRDSSAAEDVVQEAMLRALKYFSTFKGTNARAWILQIVRNVAYKNLRSTQEIKTVSIDSEPDENAESIPPEALIDPSDDPIATLIKQRERGYLTALLNRLPTDLRECLVLRELEDLSYNEIAEIANIPLGTVMSRLWRARRLLIEAVQQEAR
ncbi:MAG: polymerase subunit sigma [Verrucomicrobiaceae bacterium]|nr:polymerase subunit sigma [Verrucomicrobiaceae bacterium]